MNISSRTECGLRALIEIAKGSTGMPVKRSAIAANQKIPLPFLTQILQTLVNGKIILSTRGRSGGYVLAKPANKMTLLEVINLLQGPVMPRYCIDAGLAASCDLAESCTLMNVWERLRDAGEDVLRNINLEDVSDRRADKQPTSRSGG